jgi:DNA-binding GntR family transcriptional regulator
MANGLERLAPLELRTFASTATELLRERILDGTLPPGTRLIETEIAGQLQISRGPVREALATLRAEGLVRDEAKRGVSVAALSDVDIRQIYEVRAALESGAARLVIRDGGESAVGALEAALQTMRDTASSGDRLAFVEADLALHEQLCRASRNDRLLQAWGAQVGLLRTLIRLETAQGRSTLTYLLGDHEAFVERIKEHDVRGATEQCWMLFQRSNAVLTGGMEPGDTDRANQRPVNRDTAHP